MNSVIICEGETDATLLQYYMQNKFKWQYADEKLKAKWIKSDEMVNFREYKNAKYLYKNNDKLVIISANSSSKLLEVLLKIDEVNKIDININFDKIVIITDNDDADSESSFLISLGVFLSEHDYIYDGLMQNNEWVDMKYINKINIPIQLELLPIVIPFNETGALETVLLNGIREKDDLHNDIVTFSEETIDIAYDKFNPPYLNGRSDCLKAKFDLTFIILTEREEYLRRRGYLQDNINWEKFDSMNQVFMKLEHLN